MKLSEGKLPIQEELHTMTVDKFMRLIDKREESSSEQSAGRSGDSNFSRALLIVILRAVHARTQGVDLAGAVLLLA